MQPSTSDFHTHTPFLPLSQVYDEDAREEKVYRRPPTYLIIASKIVRPSTIYQVVVSLLEEAKPMRVRAALSRDGVEVYGDHVNMKPKESRTILLQVREKERERKRVEADGKYLLVLAGDGLS